MRPDIALRPESHERTSLFARALALCAALGALAMGCEVGLGPGPAAGAASSKEAERDLLTRVELREVAPSVFVHTSYKDLPDLGVFPSNGLLLCGKGEGGLVDTAWSDEATVHLLDEAQRRGCPVKQAIFTHSHDDRTGGLSTLFARGVTVHASAETTKLLARPGFAPELLVSPAKLVLGGIEVEALFPGAAHTTDNLVVHVPQAALLFGGCMVKSADAKTLGNVKDAHIRDWPASIAAVEARYGAVTRVVVPGHGKEGDLGLLKHTSELAARAVDASPK
jgi:glyoxylase-like metal-dependent hydrolase (beta-lactamase superfamily II)